MFLANYQKTQNKKNFPVFSTLTDEKHLPLVATAFLTFHCFRDISASWAQCFELKFHAEGHASVNTEA